MGELVVDSHQTALLLKGYSSRHMLPVANHKNQSNHGHLRDIMIFFLHTNNTCLDTAITPSMQYHGINVKSCYCDFDRHHRGLVTQSQVSYRPSELPNPKIHALLCSIVELGK